jgi:hypothetical protein
MIYKNIVANYIRNSPGSAYGARSSFSDVRNRYEMWSESVYGRSIRLTDLCENQTKHSRKFPHTACGYKRVHFGQKRICFVYETYPTLTNRLIVSTLAVKPECSCRFWTRVGRWELQCTSRYLKKLINLPWMDVAYVWKLKLKIIVHNST